MSIPILILIISLFNFVLGFFVVKSDPNKRLNRYFGFGAFMMGLWVILNYFFSNYNSALVLKMIYAQAPFLVIAQLLWVALIKEDKFTRGIKIFNGIALLINSVFLVVFFTDPNIITNVKSYAEYSTGPMFNIYMAYVAILFVSLIGYMIYQYFQSDKVLKRKFLTIIFGLIFIMVIASIVGFVLPAIGISKYNLLDSASSIFFVLAGVYSIVKTKFLNVRTFATEVISYLLLILMFVLLFVGRDEVSIYIRALLFVGLIFGVYTMIKSVKNEVEQKEKNQKLAKDLREANIHLKELDKTKDDFLSMASHELNTPIAAIEGYLSMILVEGLGGKIPDKARKYLDSVFQSSQRLAHLVKDLLNVSRIESDRIHIIYEECQIIDLINQAIMEIGSKVQEKHHTLIFKQAKAKMPITWLDKTRITEVLINIIGNSVKYTPENGTIEVKVVHDDDKIVVSVSDNGKGIPNDRNAAVFEKFTQVDVLKDEVKGTGLGMYISKRFIELHKGKIWFHSDGADKGTTFFFSLPIYAKKPYDPFAGEGSVLH
ncbi:MAG: ATP-binding protein [Candidatus Berkelbacteria bacterium]